MSVKGICGLAAAVCLLFGSAAHSALVTSLKFKDPTGIVSPTDVIEIWATLSVAPESDPFVIDASLGYPFGLPSSFIPSHANQWFSMVPFASYTAVNTMGGFFCTGNFFDRCAEPGTNYKYGNTFGPDSITQFPSAPINLGPGESQDFLFGTFTPTEGGAALGDYIFYDMYFVVHFSGLDAAGNHLSASVQLGSSTCASGSLACAFTRTVVSDVPIPAAGVLFLSGLGLVGVARQIYRR